MSRHREEPERLTPPWEDLPWLDAWQERFARLAQRAMPPTLLLAGRAGMGKGVLAARLAAMAVCATRSACGSCDGCTWFRHGRHPEILWWEQTDGGLLLTEAAAELQEFLSLNPDQADARVAVVRHAERLSRAAANRLLKLLEEPPPRARLILTSDRPERVLGTIRSRALMITVDPPPTEVALTWLKARGVEDNARRWLAELGGAPLAVLRRHERGDDPARAVVERVLAARSLREVSEAAKEAATLKGAENIAGLFRHWEICLNGIYKQLSETKTGGQFDPQSLRRLTVELRASRRLAAAGVPLNPQLAAESLGTLSYRWGQACKE